MYEDKRYHPAATEYLVAFIKHLADHGKNIYEIEKLLDAHADLINKLVGKDTPLAKQLADNTEPFYAELRRNNPDPEQLRKAMQALQLSYYEPSNTYYHYGNFLKNIGPWQRQHHFTDAVSYHINRKKKYTKNDFDVLTALSTPASAALNTPVQKFTDRDLSPDYKLQLMNDIYDGLLIKQVSEKYNCSQLAAEQTCEDQKIILPVTNEAIEERIIPAIKNGYSLEQLTKRFINFDVERIKELIKIHRILAAQNNL